MSIELLQSHYCVARSLVGEGEFEAALNEAELAVDQLWKDGDARIVEALPLLSMLRHSTGTHDSLFNSLGDLPCSFSTDLLAEAEKLDLHFANDSSLKMLADVNRFLEHWGGEERQASAEQLDSTSAADEKVSELRTQIAQFYRDGERTLAIEASLELANEYALRGKKKRAFKLFAQVSEKSRRPDRVGVRINCLLDFGQFMSQNGKAADAERLFRLAAGVTKKARDKEKYAQAIASLGVVLMHQSKNEMARKQLEKAHSMLNVWDVEADIVSQHLEALKEGVACDCPEASLDLSFATADWD